MIIALTLTGVSRFAHAAAAPEACAELPSFRSPLAIVFHPDGRRLYVANRAADTIAILDVEQKRKLVEFAIGRSPYGLALSPDGKRLFATVEEDNAVVVVDTSRWEIVSRLPTGRRPRGLAISPMGGERLYVANSDDATVSVIALTQGGEERRIAVDADPQSIAVTPDETRLVVSCDTMGQVDRSLIVINLTSGKSSRCVLPSSSNLHGLAISPDGHFALVAHQQPKSRLPATQVAGGWVFTNVVSLVDLSGPDPSLAGTAAIDDPHHGLADPSAVAITPDGQRVFLAAAGADLVLLLDPNRLKEAARSAMQHTAAGPYGPVTSLVESRRFVRAQVAVGSNPRGMALSPDGNVLAVSNYLADTVTVLNAATLERVGEIELGSAAPDLARYGEILFNRASLADQGQFSCASCHPDGHTDGLNWDLQRDGIGNFKNTRSLLGVRHTAPYGWSGASPDLAHRVTGTMRTLMRHEPTAEEIAAVVAYLERLDAPPASKPEPGDTADSVARGQTIFEGKGRCTGCHSGPWYTRSEPADVGTKGSNDPSDRFDVPSLRGAARTAPYLHDGRARTLEEIFTRHNSSGLHGLTAPLSAAELADLVAFLRSL